MAKTESWGELNETLDDVYKKYHPQVLTDFEQDLEKYWGRRWKANNTAGKLRMVLLHRPGKEFLSVGKPTPWPPHLSSLEGWRMSFKPNLDELIRDHENLVKAYQREGVEVVIRKPDPNDPPYQVKSIYTDDVCHAAVYGQIILRMYDYVRRGEELPTYQTLAEIGCPVVGMIIGKGMTEGGTIGWLDEKHLVIGVHYPRANTKLPELMRANESGHLQFAKIVKMQDPEVDVRIYPGYAPYTGPDTYAIVGKHTSIQDPKYMDPFLVDWMKAEMDWQFIPPPEEFSRVDARGKRKGPDTGVVLEHMKILVPAGNPKEVKWLESVGVKVIQVECSSLVRPRNSGTIHCATGALIRDPEKK